MYDNDDNVLCNMYTVVLSRNFLPALMPLVSQLPIIYARSIYDQVNRNIVIIFIMTNDINSTTNNNDNNESTNTNTTNDDNTNNDNEYMNANEVGDISIRPSGQAATWKGALGTKAMPAN